MISGVYIIGLFMLFLLILGFILKEYSIVNIGATGLIIFGIYGISNGFPDMSDWGNTIFSIFDIIIGLYILIRGILEQFNQ